MKLIKLDVNQAPLIVDKNYDKAGVLNLVVGNQAETFLDSAVLACDASKISISQQSSDEKETESLFDILEDMINDPICYQHFHDMLVESNELFQAIEPNDRSNFRYQFRFKDLISTKTQTKLLKFTPPLFQVFFSIGLLAFKPLHGQVFIYNIDKIKLKYSKNDAINIKLLIKYLVKIAEARGNRFIISTQNMVILKTFNEIMIKNPEIDSAVIIMSNNTPDNCSILKQAKIESDLFNKLLS